MVERLGVQNVQFDELYSIDSDLLRELAPVHAVIFLFKYGSVDREYAEKNEPLDGAYDPHYAESGIFFANQTIQNACATQAVLNSLLNKTQDVEIGDELKNFREFVAGFDSTLCGEAVSNSESIRLVHNSFSAPRFIESDSRPRNVDEKNDGLFHFVTFLNINNAIYELDGLKPYPIRHVSLANGGEFYEKLPEVIQRRIAKYSGEIRFSLLALTDNKLKHYEEIGDEVGASLERVKRETWKRENELRRHDFPKLVIDLLRNISAGMSDAEWEQLLSDARKKSENRARDRGYY